jgi:hypothetical protein
MICAGCDPWLLGLYRREHCWRISSSITVVTVSAVRPLTGDLGRGCWSAWALRRSVAGLLKITVCWQWGLRCWGGGVCCVWAGEPGDRPVCLPYGAAIERAAARLTEDRKHGGGAGDAADLAGAAVMCWRVRQRSASRAGGPCSPKAARGVAGAGGNFEVRRPGAVLANPGGLASRVGAAFRVA